MITTQVAFTVLAVVFSVLTLTGNASVPAMYALSLVFGVITAFDNPARRVLVSELVAEQDLPNAVGLNSALMTGSRVVGPALAGALIAGPGAGSCFVVNAVTYFAVIGALLRMDRSAFRAAPPVAKAKGQLREGFRYVWRTPELRLSLTLVGVVGVAAFNYQVSLPLLAERTFGGDATTFTLLYATMSAGSVGGALAVARMRDIHLSFLVRAGAALTISTLALAFAPIFPLALLAAVPVGFTSIFLISGASAAVQLASDPSMRGRVLALLGMLLLGSTPIGSPIIGWIADVSNARMGIAIGAIATALATVWTARRMRSRDVPGGEADLEAEPVAA
jgi:MFS family permease